MKLFGHPDSGHAYKVKLCMQFANIAHDYEQIDIYSDREARPAEFRKHARYHEVPLLIDEGAAYVQSNAILIHLASKYKILGAENERSFSLCVEWLFWEANKIGLCLPQLRASNKFSQSTLSEGAHT